MTGEGFDRGRGAGSGRGPLGADRRHPPDQVAQAEREWQWTFDAISDVVLILDPDLRVVRANKAAQEILGQAGPLVGRVCCDLWRLPAEEKDRCPCQRTRQDRQAARGELFSAAGVPFLVSTSPILDEDGSFLGMVQVSRDISAMKRLQADLDKKIQYLQSFKEVMVARENRMVEVKEELNRLCREMGREPPYFLTTPEEG